MIDPAATTRRGFLQGLAGLAGASASLAAVGRITMLPGEALADGGPGFFSEREREILGAIAERMVDSDDPAAPPLADTDALGVVDRLCTRLDPGITQPLPLALQLFEWGPLLLDLGHFSRFTRLPDHQKDASLAGWMNSRFAVRRLAFQALRNLAFLGYYSQASTWPGIGYRGPLLERRSDG